MQRECYQYLAESVVKFLCESLALISECGRDLIHMTRVRYHVEEGENIGGAIQLYRHHIDGGIYGFVGFAV
jgi:hypothetical protein